MEDVISTLVDCAYLPISIIIVGIGKGDFTNMTLLDGDEKQLIDHNNRKCIRDLV